MLEANAYLREEMIIGDSNRNSGVGILPIP
jgi:hypothetical protein